MYFTSTDNVYELVTENRLIAKSLKKKYKQTISKTLKLERI